MDSIYSMVLFFPRTSISVMHFSCEHELISFSQYWSAKCARLFSFFSWRAQSQTEQHNGALHVSTLLSVIEAMNWCLKTRDSLYYSKYWPKYAEIFEITAGSSGGVLADSVWLKGTEEKLGELTWCRRIGRLALCWGNIALMVLPFIY